MRGEETRKWIHCCTICRKPQGDTSQETLRTQQLRPGSPANDWEAFARGPNEPLGRIGKCVQERNVRASQQLERFTGMVARIHEIKETEGDGKEGAMLT